MTNCELTEEELADLNKELDYEALEMENEFYRVALREIARRLRGSDIARIAEEALGPDE